MTATTLRRTKANVWGAGIGMPIIGIGITGASPPYSLEAWVYDDSGGYMYTASTVVLPSAVTSFGLFSFTTSRIVHLASGPWVLFSYSAGSLSSDLQYVFAWDIKHDALYTTSIALPDDAGDTPVVTIPFIAPGLTGWIYYYLTYKVSGSVWNHLYKTPLTGGGFLLVGDASLPTAGFTTARQQAFDAAYAYTFYGLDSAVPYAWKWPLGAGAPSKSPTSSLALAPDNPRAPLYSAGADGSYDYFFGGAWCDPASPSPDGKQWLIKRERATDLWTAAAAFATPSANTTAWHTTINRSGNVSGFFPWDAAGGVVLKLAQPRGTTASPGNDGADPLITLDLVGGQAPIFAHLCDLEHVWS